MIRDIFARCQSEFRRNERGSVATMFAMSSIPLVAVAGLAIDYNRVVQSQTALRDYADRVALTAAARGGTEEQMEEAANAYIAAENIDLPGLTFTTGVEATGTDVRVTINADLEATLLSAVYSATGQSGGDSDITIVSRANYTAGEDGEPICILTTNTSAANAMYFNGSAGVTATGCGFHSDSSDASGLYGGGSADITADFYSVVGGASTDSAFVGGVKEGAAVKGDPFNINPTCPSGSGSPWVPSGTLASPSTTTTTHFSSIAPSANKYGRLPSGTIYVTGTISIQNNRGLLSGTSGTTIVLCGPSAKFNHQGGTLQVQAPTTGTYKGFAVIGNSTATATSELRGGNNTYLRGIYYTPKGDLDIKGNSTFNVDSQYFPVVVDEFDISGSAGMNIEMDYAAYGYEEREELLSPSEESVVRLTR